MKNFTKKTLYSVIGTAVLFFFTSVLHASPVVKWVGPSLDSFKKSPNGFSMVDKPDLTATLKVEGADKVFFNGKAVSVAQDGTLTKKVVFTGGVAIVSVKAVSESGEYEYVAKFITKKAYDIYMKAKAKKEAAAPKQEEVKVQPAQEDPVQNQAEPEKKPVEKKTEKIVEETPAVESVKQPAKPREDSKKIIKEKTTKTEAPVTEKESKPAAQEAAPVVAPVQKTQPESKTEPKTSETKAVPEAAPAPIKETTSKDVKDVPAVKQPQDSKAQVEDKPVNLRTDTAPPPNFSIPLPSFSEIASPEIPTLPVEAVEAYLKKKQNLQFFCQR